MNIDFCRPDSVTKMPRLIQLLSSSKYEYDCEGFTREAINIWYIHRDNTLSLETEAHELFVANELFPFYVIFNEFRVTYASKHQVSLMPVFKALRTKGLDAAYRALADIKWPLTDKLAAERDGGKLY